MGASIFNLPELVLLISQYLDPCDLARMMATCKDLAQQFEPMLWRNLTIQKHHFERDTILRNRDYIRVLQFIDVPKTIEQQFIDTILELPRAFNIQRCETTTLTEFGLSSKVILHNLNQIYIRGTGYFEKAFLLVNHSSQLTRLDIAYTVPLPYPPASARKILGSFTYNVQQLACLKYLKLSGDIISYDILPLFQACLLHPILQELYLISPSGFISPNSCIEYLNSSLRLLEARYKSTGTKSNIHSIEIPGLYLGYPAMFITTLLHDHLPNLERFTLPGVRFDPRNNLREIYGRLCSKIQHLSIISIQYNSGTEIFIAECSKDPGLKSFRAGNVYVRGSDIVNYELVLNTLTRCHSATLVDIEITGYTSIKSPPLQNILMNCRKLRRLWICCWSGWNSALNINDIASGEWVCLDLKELRLVLEWSDVVEMPRELSQKVYAQLGRLVKLEKFYIGYLDRWLTGRYFLADLTLSQGWLSEFAGLSQLREFAMTSEFWKKVGQNEIEFMHTHWGNIETIICISREFWKKPARDNIQEMPHWQWLKNQRPRLTIKAADYI